MSGRLLLVLSELAALALFYGAGARRVARWPAWRSACFAAGLAVTGGALAFDPPTLVLHMGQHLGACAGRRAADRSRLAAGARPACDAGPPRAPLDVVGGAGGGVGDAGGGDGGRAPPRGPRRRRGAPRRPRGPARGLAGRRVLFWRPVLGADPCRTARARSGGWSTCCCSPRRWPRLARCCSGAARPGTPATRSPTRRGSGVLMLVGGGLTLAAWTVAITWAALLREHRRRLAVEELIAA